MTQKDEWGPWIEHDGRGCPCVGQYVRVKQVDMPEKEAIAGEECKKLNRDFNGEMSAWVWDKAPQYSNVIRYRIRKPRGMAVLESILADMPETIHSKEDV